MSYLELIFPSAIRQMPILPFFRNVKKGVKLKEPMMGHCAELDDSRPTRGHKSSE